MPSRRATTARGRRLRAGRSLRARLALAAAAAATTAVAALAVLGWQLAIDRSDSMRPALRAGDLLVLRPVELAEAPVGDILTFPDPGTQGRTLTHRLVARTETAGRLEIRTQGDANTASETWEATDDAVVHRVTLRVPHAGRVLAALSAPLVRSCAATGLIVLVAVSVLRRIWSSEVL